MITKQYRVQFSVDQGRSWSNTTHADHRRTRIDTEYAVLRAKHAKDPRVSFRVVEEPLRASVSDAQVNAYCDARDLIPRAVDEYGSRPLGERVEAATVLLWQMLQSGYAGPFPVIPCRDYDPNNYDSFDYYN